MHQTYINLIAENLDYGESLREECPECHGKDRTLSVTKDSYGTVLYQCFRASCPLKGIVGGVARSEGPTARPKRKVWEGATEALPDDVATWIQREWGISEPPHWYFTTDLGGRIAMSIRSPMDTHRGWVLRNDGSQQPKALTYLDEGDDALALSWYLRPGILDRSAAGTILVEDIPSALRASAYVNAVSLVGTACGEDKAQEIREHKRGTVWIALDQDATDQALKLQRQYSLLWDEPRVLPLEQDLKNMNEADLCQLLKKIKQ